MTNYTERLLRTGKAYRSFGLILFDFLLFRNLRDKFRLNLTGKLDRPESLEEMLEIIPEIQEIFILAQKKNVRGVFWGC